MVLPQQEEAAARNAGFTGLYELVERTTDGYDVRDNTTFYKEKTISIHRTEAGAYKAGLKANYIVRPLKAKD